MRAVLISIGKILAFLGLWALLLGGVVMVAVQGGGEDWFAITQWRLWMEIGGAVAIFIALCIMAFMVDKRGWRTLGLSFDASLVGLPLGVFLGALIFAAPVAVLSAMGAATYLGFDGFEFGALGLALTLCVFNVLHQELLGRSYIFQELWTKFGAAIAIIATSLFFMLLHAAPILSGGAQGLIAAANILLASIMMGLAYVRTNALWMPIGIHFGWNALQGPVLGINVTGAEIGGGWSAFGFTGDALLTGGALGVEGGAIGLLGPLLGLAIVAAFVRRKT